MKKTILIVAVAASLLASVVMLVCYNPENETVDGKKGYANPIDKDGDNYLNGRGGDPTYSSRCGEGVDKNGVAHFFDTADVICNPPCDPIYPTIELNLAVGGQSVTITTNETTKLNDLLDFTKSITWTSGAGGTANPNPQNPCLSRGGGDCLSAAQAMQTPTNYVITYTVTKPKCGDVEPRATATRQVNIEQFTAPDTGTPVIEHNGDNPTEIRENQPYVERGVKVTIKYEGREQEVTAKALDSVVIKCDNATYPGYPKTVRRSTGGAVNFAEVVLPSNLAAGNKFTITYYASYDKTSPPTTKNTAKWERTVNVAQQAQSNIEPVIVLKTYKLKMPGSSGKVVDYPDTMIYLPATDANYTDQGVDRVFYLKNGAEVSVPTNLVQEPVRTNPFITNQASPPNIPPTVTYNIPAGDGYAAGKATRNVFLVYTAAACASDEVAPKDPTVTLLESDTIQAGKSWNHGNSWRVANNNDHRGSGYKYLIDFNGLNPYNPQPKAGGYNITYVGLGKCGETVEKSRTIYVK